MIKPICLVKWQVGHEKLNMEKVERMRQAIERKLEQYYVMLLPSILIEDLFEVSVLNPTTDITTVTLDELKKMIQEECDALFTKEEISGE